MRGPSVIQEYFNNSKANSESWDSEGYFMTGDVVYCDRKTKKWYIVDRKKVSALLSHCKILLTYCSRNLSKFEDFKLPPRSWKRCYSMTQI